MLKVETGSKPLYEIIFGSKLSEPQIREFVYQQQQIKRIFSTISEYLLDCADIRDNKKRVSKELNSLLTNMESLQNDLRDQKRYIPCHKESELNWVFRSLTDFRNKYGSIGMPIPYPDGTDKMLVEINKIIVTCTWPIRI